MMTHRPTHHGQLLASAVVLCCMTVAVILTARWIDDDASRWAPVAAACATLWLFSVAWAMLAVGITIDSWLAARRAPQEPQRYKPAPGTGGRAPTPSLAELAADEAAWRWAAQARTIEDAEHLAVAELAAEPDEYLTEARHAAERAAA